MSEQKHTPRVPTEEMWGGLARDLIMWRDMVQRPTGKSLYEHLRRSGREIPDWLLKEIPDVDHVPPKGTRAAVIWMAMWDAAPDLSAASGRAPTNKEE